MTRSFVTRHPEAENSRFSVLGQGEMAMANSSFMFVVQCGRMEQRGAKRMGPRFQLATKSMTTSFFEDRTSRLELQQFNMLRFYLHAV